MSDDRELLELLEQAVANLRGRIYQTEHEPEAEARATLLAYNAEHPDAPMTWWPGGEKAPEDWDGGKVLFKTGVTGNVAGRWTATIGYRQKAEAALQAGGLRLVRDLSEVEHKFPLGARVTKTKGSKWTGHVVGFYSTSLTAIGYVVESENEPGSAQIYPEAALASTDAVLGPVKGEG